MGKISLVSTKYIIQAQIEIDGVVERPDVIGSVFGQTEGLLGSGLELRELQRSGRIGRIEVDLEVTNGKTKGMINIPSSLDKTETALIAAAVETIQRIGPCNATVKVDKLEDVRISKRSHVLERAKELLSTLKYSELPDTKGIKEEVSDSVRMMNVEEYGKERLPAGPEIDSVEDIIVVEGRADVLNLLKHDIKNSIALNGTSVPKTIAKLSKEKTVTVFVDGDRGGDLIIKGLLGVADVDFICKAPAGKEVEELTQKEILQALRKKVSFEQALKDLDKKSSTSYRTKTTKAPTRTGTRTYTPRTGTRTYTPRTGTRTYTPRTTTRGRKPAFSRKESETFKKMLNNLIGTKGAYLLDKETNILGKVPTRELESTMEGLRNETYAVVLDGKITKEIATMAERSRVKFLVAAETKETINTLRTRIITKKDLQ